MCYGNRLIKIGEFIGFCFDHHWSQDRFYDFIRVILIQDPYKVFMHILPSIVCLSPSILLIMQYYSFYSKCDISKKWCKLDIFWNCLLEEIFSCINDFFTFFICDCKQCLKKQIPSHKRYVWMASCFSLSSLLKLSEGKFNNFQRWFKTSMPIELRQIICCKEYTSI